MGERFRTSRGYFGIPPVWDRGKPPRPLLSYRRFFTMSGDEKHEFKTEDEAFQFRSERLLERERKRELRYDRNAPYISVSVHPPPIPYTTRTVFGKDYEDPGVANHIDVEAFELGIQHTCERIARDGFEVIAITPLQSAIHQGRAKYSWAWSFTAGVIITARKARETQ